MAAYEGQVAFITGGASGIGLGIARALGAEGATLILADIEPATLKAAAELLRDGGATVRTEVLDVRDEAAYRAVAERTLARFETVHILVNNAGVGSHTPAGATPMEDWRWVIDVNLLGVVQGVELFLPAMLESGATCHIVNTASLAGHVAMPGMGAYAASKFAVVGYSEALRHELAESAVGVSVLCPAWVKTRIAQSRRNHPAADTASGGAEDALDLVGQLIAQDGLEVEAVVEHVMAGLRDGTFYLFTHPDYWPFVEERLERVRADYARVMPPSS